jgi:WD40 repeat protein
MRILTGHAAPVLSLAYSPDSRQLASGDGDAVLRIWDMATGETTYADNFSFDMSDYGHGGREPILSLAFAPSGRFLAVGKSSAFHILDRSRNNGLDYFYARTYLGSISLAFSAASGWLFVAGFFARSIEVLDTNDERESFTLSGDASGTLALAHSPCAPLLAVGGDYPGKPQLQLWSIATKTGWPSMGLVDHQAPVLCVAFAPQGTPLVSGSRDGTIHLWNVESSDQQAILRGHNEPVVALSFTPDGRTLASAGASGSIRLWNVANAREQAAYDWHVGRVRSVAIAPDGMTAAVGGSDGSVLIWDLD